MLLSPLRAYTWSSSNASANSVSRWRALPSPLSTAAAAAGSWVQMLRMSMFGVAYSEMQLLFLHHVSRLAVPTSPPAEVM